MSSITDSAIRRERLTDYERAICYYTLPRVVPPVTIGLLFAYAVCLLEAVGALAWGLVNKHDTVTRIGAWALAGIVVLGITAFLFRALLAEVRRRRALAAARYVPNALQTGEEDAHVDIDELPDPFADHVLIRCPLSHHHCTLACTDNSGHKVYVIENGSGEVWRRMKNENGHEVVWLKLESRSSSFSLKENTPSRVAIYRDKTLVARFSTRFALGEPAATLECFEPEPRVYTLRSNGLYLDKELKGRLYDLRGYLYLDVHKSVYDFAVLGLFTMMV